MKYIIIFICLLISIIIWRKYIEFENYVDESLSYFDWKYYINNNPNILEDINSEEKAIDHYVNKGKFLNYSVYPVTYGNNKNKSYLAILAIFKNETMIIETWIKHYIWQGVDHIYLIDNDSNDNPLDILQPYIDNGYITLYQLPGKYKQMTHFKYVYEKENLRENTKWLMNIDVDEYMYCNNCDIKKELYKYDNYYVIYTQWRVFGSNNLELQPKDPRISFTLRHKNLSWHSKKYLIQTKHINLNNFHNTPHKILNIDDDKIINLPYIFMLNHYQIMSLEYFKKIKMTRGDVDYHKRDSIRQMNYFNEINKYATFRDDDLKMLTINKFYNYDNICASGTLEDRIKLILYYIDQDQHDIQINWVLDNNFNEEFNNLFKDIPNIKITNVKNSNIVDNRSKYMYVFNKNNYELLQPVQLLQKKINNIITLLENVNIYHGNKNEYIACHILSNDYNKYVSFIDKYSNKLKIYIMTNNKNIQNDFINIYNDRIIVNKNIDNYSIKEELIDIYVCNNATYFIN